MARLTAWQQFEASWRNHQQIPVGMREDHDEIESLRTELAEAREANKFMRNTNAKMKARAEKAEAELEWVRAEVKDALEAACDLYMVGDESGRPQALRSFVLRRIQGGEKDG